MSSTPGARAWMHYFWPAPLASGAAPAVRWPEGLIVGLVLVLVFALLHHGALNVGWTFDDPAHLHFAATYGPLQYFTDREVMLRQSYAHITPWNILFYDLGLPWAGLDARLHHVHLLAVLWAVALATWVLLRRWLNPSVALAAALLFVAMPATGMVGRMLMTGHYAYGLLFSVLAIHAWVKAIHAPPGASRGHAVVHASLAAFFYMLACLCKELYAPLPAVLVCMPALNLSIGRRFALLSPTVVVAAGYAGLRLWLFGGAGGHAVLALGQPPAIDIPGMLEQFRVLLLGLGGVGWAALVVCCLVVVCTCRRTGAKRWPVHMLVLWAGASIALLLPVASLARAGELGYGHHRLVLALAWTMAVVLAWQLQYAGRVGWALAWVLAGLLATAQNKATVAVDAHSQSLAKHYDFLLRGTADDVLIPRNFERVGYMKAMADTIQTRSGHPAPVILGDDEQVAALGSDAGARAHAWFDDCACLRPLGAEAYIQRVRLLEERLAKGSDHFLELDLRLEDDGPRKALRWKLVGQPDAVNIWFDVPDIGRLYIPQEGQFAFGVDNTFPILGPLVLRFSVETADGALIRTPFLRLPMTGASALKWHADAPAPILVRPKSAGA